MKLFSTLLALMLAVPAVTSAQTIDPATDLTGYTRFLVYPHLEQGLESMRQGDRTRALSELERAHSLAPSNATVALHLATAYQTFGELRRAESLLREQIKLTPGDARLLAALTGLPPIKCSSTIRSATSLVTEWYQVPSGYTTAIGPCSQIRRQFAFVRYVH